jgi:hypothetical protein
MLMAVLLPIYGPWLDFRFAGRGSGRARSIVAVPQRESGDGCPPGGDRECGG